MTKNILSFCAVLGVILLFSPIAQAQSEAKSIDNTPFFYPDMTEALLAEALIDANDGIEQADGLPEITPFGVDMVDRELVSNDGSDVYVAVLDTGLVEEWPFFFSQANIAWEVEIPISVDPPITLKVPITGGTDEMVSAGIYYIADLAENDLAGKRVVINMSLGGPTPSPMIEDAVDYAISKGVIVVASAGNSGTDGMGYPGGLSQIISAGAGGWADMFNMGPFADVPEKLKSKDSMGNTFQHYLEDFSSRPNKDLDQKTQDLDVSAPGAWIVGPYRQAFSDDLGYWYVSGTSQAAPHVSGIASLVPQSKPDLTQAQMEKILSLGANDLPFAASDAIVSFPFEEPFYYFAPWDGGDYGAGLLQADEALKAAASKYK